MKFFISDELTAVFEAVKLTALLFVKTLLLNTFDYS